MRSYWTLIDQFSNQILAHENVEAIRNDEKIKIKLTQLWRKFATDKKLDEDFKQARKDGRVLLETVKK